MTFSFECTLRELHTRDPFGLSRGTRRAVSNLFIRCGEGLGEGAPIYYKGQNAEDMLALARALPPDLAAADPAEAASLVLARHPGETALAEAVDLALYDAWGKREKKPLHELWGLDSTAVPLSSFTIGLDSLDVMLQKIERVNEYPIIKVKLGGVDDVAILEAIRERSSQSIYIDANEGWTLDETIARLPELKRLGVELLEQPLPRADLDGYARLFEANRTGIPLFVDEGVQGPEDVERWAGRADGINVKLAKCGGLGPGRRCIERARACGLKVLLGCMLESSLAISAAAQLAPLADYADLDGAALLSDDPFEGMRMEAGRLTLPNRPGLGAVERSI
ncbi:MAG: dipeptide epimerase [bacterium]|nr:dipeptide epimerase [bacterium]